MKSLLPNLRSSRQAKLRALCAISLLFAQTSSIFARRGHRQTRTATVTVFFAPGAPANRFSPARAIGAGIDGHAKGETERQLSPANVREMLSAGLKPLTYRLRTELANEAWHWNPNGRWSDAAHQEGYWTSDSKPAAPIDVCYGYRLPRRGNTIDQANDDGYSRIDDGDTQTFWKSNPYLDEHFTGEKNSLHPQWIMIDLGARRQIDDAKILWGEPFATDYAIEFGHSSAQDDLTQRLPDVWRAFPNGEITKGKGGDVSLRLSRPILVRYVRVRLNESSHTAMPGSAGDIRDALGYAVREIYFGSIDRRGRFHDAMKHGQERNAQSVVYVSSTDPWHRETDRDVNTEQPGFDFIYRSGLANGLPAMIPVPVLYDTPENAAAEIRYLKARSFPFERIEMGEEPDGQFVTPEHFGALYLQFAKALHDVDPSLLLGGPSLQDIEQSPLPDRLDLGKGGWMKRFLSYLNERGRSRDFSFFSFEWYPFDNDCVAPARQLAEASEMLNDGLHELELGGLPHDIPWVIAEYGYSAFGARAEVDLDGALLNADIIGRFLTLGGDAAFLYGYEPGEVINEEKCSSGNNMLFFIGEDGRISARTATYWGARLITQEWLQPGNEIHELYRAESDVHDVHGNALITAYAVHRPDGLWSVLLINKDPKITYETNIFVKGPTERGKNFKGSVDVFQFSRKEYALGGTPLTPYPIRSKPPEHTIIKSVGKPLQVSLAPYSLTVVRGRSL